VPLARSKDEILAPEVELAAFTNPPSQIRPSAQEFLMDQLDRGVARPLLAGREEASISEMDDEIVPVRLDLAARYRTANVVGTVTALHQATEQAPRPLLPRRTVCAPAQVAVGGLGMAAQRTVEAANTGRGSVICCMRDLPGLLAPPERGKRKLKQRQAAGAAIPLLLDRWRLLGPADGIVDQALD
jgi:hypothetical protein